MKRVAQLFCIGGMFAAPVTAQARESREVQPERPTVATHAGTVAPGFLEVEWGGELSPGSNLSLPVYFKLGMRERLQLGLLVPVSDTRLRGVAVGDMQVALKVRVTDNHPVLGDFAIQPSLSLPTGSGIDGSQYAVLLISSHEFGKLAVDINAGLQVSTTSTSDRQEWLWMLSLGAPFTGKWGWVGELSGTGTTGSSTTQLLAGPTYRLHSWFALDAGVIAPARPTGDVRFYVGGVTNTGRVFGK